MIWKALPAFLMTTIRSVPTNVPVIAPRPPASEAPPITAVAGVRHGAEDTAGEHDGSDAIDKAGEGVNKVEGLADLDAAQAGDLDAGADDEQVAAEDGVAQDQEGNDCHDDPDAGQDRQDAEDVIVADGVKELDER